jgi:hypothetical protein
MKTRFAFQLIFAATTLTVSVISGAHHSISMFDGRRVVKIAGTVAAFRWINPHASFELEVHGESGAFARWVVEMQPPTAMMDAGWTRDTLAVGDHVTVFANPLRKPPAAGDASRLLYAGIILANGRMLGRAGEL